MNLYRYTSARMAGLKIGNISLFTGDDSLIGRRASPPPSYRQRATMSTPASLPVVIVSRK
jgi:hypothetical protein